MKLGLFWDIALNCVRYRKHRDARPTGGLRKQEIVENFSAHARELVGEEKQTGRCELGSRVVTRISCNSLHTKPQPPLIIGFKNLYANHLPFLEMISYVIDALVGNLRDVQ